MSEISEHTAEVVEVGELIPHPNADNLSIVLIGDFQCIVRTNDWQCGDLAIYIEPDSIVPETKEFEFLGEHRRIKARKLRGEWSVGLLIPAPEGAKVGDDYMKQLGITHYDPPVKGDFNTGGENVKPPRISEHSTAGLFTPVYDVLNFRKYSERFQAGEEVIVTEKIHGCVNSTTRISMPNGQISTIKELIDQNYNGEILGYDFDLNKVVPTKVKQIYKNGKGNKWIRIKFNRYGAGRGNYFGSLKCTDNHKIFSVNHNCFIEAQFLKIDDTVRLIRSEWNLTPIQEQVLMGKMLGDGSYGHSNSAGFVCFSHKKDHEDYLLWTEQALGEVCGNRQAEYVSGYGTNMIRSRSISNVFIKDLFRDWFVNNRKEVPVSITPKLGPIALAFWYMDDGSLVHNEGQEDRAVFATNGFSEESIDNLILALAKFDIHAIKYSSSGWRLRLKSDDAEKLFLIIAPYVPLVMQYKLPKRYRGHNGWIPSKENIYKSICVDQSVISIEHIKENRQKYDLETETHNYFAHGILIHNCNSRFVCVDDKMYCGSRRFWKQEDPNNLWWKALANCGVLEAWCRHHQGLPVYGEVFGQVQNLKYGATKGEIYFAAFDILKGNQWLDFDEAHDIGASLPWVPLVYRGPFYKDKIFAFAEGGSLYPFAQNIREGVVIKPVHERTDRKIGRVQLKIVSNQYLSKS